MKGGKRYGIRFLSYAQTAKKSKGAFASSKSQAQKKTIVLKVPFGRLILGKCGGC